MDWFSKLVASLEAVTTVSELVRAIILHAEPAFELKGIAFVFLSRHGVPTLGITNFSGPEPIRHYMTEVYAYDPFLKHVLDNGASAGLMDIMTMEQIKEFQPRGTQPFREADDQMLESIRTMVMNPLCGVGEIVGVIQFWPASMPDRATRERLDRMCLVASLRLAQLGVRCPVYSSRLAGLTPRQAEIARRAASGATNVEVADELGITINTVKKLLKQVFTDLDVTNRTELATLLSRSLPHIGHADYPAGYFQVAIDADRPSPRS